MATCKDCVHWEACVDLLRNMGYTVDGDGCDADKRCKTFKDRSLFVELPCKRGDPVHIIRECSCYCANENWKNKRKKCSGKVYLGKRLRTHHCGYVSKAKFDLKYIADFGKLVFLTNEEAEAALAERKKKDVH